MHWLDRVVWVKRNWAGWFCVSMEFKCFEGVLIILLEMKLAFVLRGKVKVAPFAPIYIDPKFKQLTFLYLPFAIPLIQVNISLLIA